jgi:hypothetical protein
VTIDSYSNNNATSYNNNNNSKDASNNKQQNVYNYNNNKTTGTTTHYINTSNNQIIKSQATRRILDIDTRTAKKDTTKYSDTTKYLETTSTTASTIRTTIPTILTGIPYGNGTVYIPVPYPYRYTCTGRQYSTGIYCISTLYLFLYYFLHFISQAAMTTDKSYRNSVSIEKSVA